MSTISMLGRVTPASSATVSARQTTPPAANTSGSGAGSGPGSARLGWRRRGRGGREGTSPPFIAAGPRPPRDFPRIPCARKPVRQLAALDGGSPLGRGGGSPMFPAARGGAPPPPPPRAPEATPPPPVS